VLVVVTSPSAVCILPRSDQRMKISTTNGLLVKTSQSEVNKQGKLLLSALDGYSVCFDGLLYALNSSCMVESKNKTKT